jgi:hypothetical protein
VAKNPHTQTWAMPPLPDALLEHIVAYVTCRERRAALGYSFDTCMKLGIPPCPLALKPTLKAHLERLVYFREHGWGIHVFYPKRQISVWFCFDPDPDDTQRLLITVSTCMKLDGPCRLRQEKRGEIRDQHIVFIGDVAPQSWFAHKWSRSRSLSEQDSPRWFEGQGYNNWFVRLEDTEEIVPLKAYCRTMNQIEQGSVVF